MKLRIDSLVIVTVSFAIERIGKFLRLSRCTIKQTILRLGQTTYGGDLERVSGIMPDMRHMMPDIVIDYEGGNTYILKDI